MEAASKACGTGLKIGIGMGRYYSLPKQSIEVSRLAPTVEVNFTGAAQDRLAALNVIRSAANWIVDDDYLISAVLLFRA